MVEYQLREPTPRHALLELFALGSTLPVERVRPLFTEDQLAALVSLQLLADSGDGKIRGQVRLQAYRDLYLISDFIDVGRTSEERVYAPGGDSFALADRLLGGTCESTLDLCTGSGIQAALTARNSRQAVAVDINPRAVHFAALNFSLNQLSTAEAVLGDLYEPVKDRRFDRVTANPPFVMSPTLHVRYRDGGARGDEILRRILDGLPAHLNPGAFAQIVTILHEFTDFSQAGFIEEFSRQNSFETLVLCAPPSDKFALASRQFESQIYDYPAYRRGVTEFLEHLDAMGFERSCLAVVTMRASGQYRFERETSIHRSVLFDRDDVKRLNAFYRLES